MPVATRTPVKREPTEPQASIKANGVGIPHLQEWEEVKIPVIKARIRVNGRNGSIIMRK